jgi:phage terminase large subunit-like protein
LAAARCLAEVRRATKFAAGEETIVAVDVGGERSATGLVWINRTQQVGCEILRGNDAILHVADIVRDLARRYRILEFTVDPWRAGQLAAELEREGMTVSEFPQQDARVVPASQRLYDAIVEKRLTLPDSPELAQHAAGAIARHSRRGWRVDRPNPCVEIDGISALVMALDRLENRPAPLELLGWL